MNINTDLNHPATTDNKIPYDCQDILALARISSNGTDEDRDMVLEMLQFLAANGTPKN